MVGIGPLTALMAVILALLTSAQQAGAGEFPFPETAPELAHIRELIKAGDTAGAVKAADDADRQYRGNRPLVFCALELKAEAYRKAGEIDKELACFHQMTGLGWRTMPRVQILGIRNRICEVAANVLAGKPEEPRERAERISGVLRGIKSYEAEAQADQRLRAQLLVLRSKDRESMGRLDEARADLLEAISVPVAPRVFSLRTQAAVALAGKDAEASLSAARVEAKDGETVFLCQAALVKSAILKQNWANALSRLKILYALCSSEDVQMKTLQEVAAELVESAAKAAAAEARAIKPETPLRTADDVGRYTARAPMALSETDTDPVRKKLETLTKKDAATLRQRVRLLLLLDHAEEALSASYEAYQQSPRWRNVQMDAVRDFLAAAKAVKGQFIDPSPFYAFAAFGPAGSDGEEGTADDIKDPFASLMQK